tara:strand:- start:489 stop:1139 length:651 start_codon:yes stop_codon:yes gene_type:complete
MENMEDAVFNQVANAATGPADTMFTDTSSYTGEDFDLGSEFALSQSGKGSKWASVSGAEGVGFEDAVASQIYKTYGEKMTGKLGEGWTKNLTGDIDPILATEGNVQFKGVGQPFLSKISELSALGDEGTREAQYLIDEYTNPDSEIFTEGGDYSFASPHVFSGEDYEASTEEGFQTFFSEPSEGWSRPDLGVGFLKSDYGWERENPGDDYDDLWGE